MVGARSVYQPEKTDLGHLGFARGSRNRRDLRLWGGAGQQGIVQGGFSDVHGAHHGHGGQGVDGWLGLALDQVDKVCRGRRVVAQDLEESSQGQVQLAAQVGGKPPPHRACQLAALIGKAIQQGVQFALQFGQRPPGTGDSSFQPESAAWRGIRPSRRLRPHPHQGVGGRGPSASSGAPLRCSRSFQLRSAPRCTPSWHPDPPRWPRFSRQAADSGARGPIDQPSGSD